MKNVIPFRGDEVLKYAIYRDGRDSIVESETLVEGTNELSDILTEAHYSYGIYKPSSNGYWISNNTQDGTFKSVVIKKGDGNSLNQEENDFITALLNKGVYSENEDDGYSWSGKQNFGVGGWIFGGFIGAFLGYQLGKAVGYGRAHQGYALGGSVEDTEKIQQLVKKWVYFTFNYPNDFISDIWGNSFLDSHFKGKFAGFYSTYGTDGVMPNFYNALDGSNRIHLAKYILENYKDYPVEGVSPEDFADVITHWNSFCFNFPYGWVQKTFNRDTNHFLAKWNKAYSDSNPSGAVNVFFTRLSGDNQDLLIDWAIKNHNKGMGKFIHGGKAQGYNDKLDESLGNTTGRKSSMEQNYKDRRDESTSMMKSEGKRKYQRVGTMDKMHNGGELKTWREDGVSDNEKNNSNSLKRNEVEDILRVLGYNVSDDNFHRFHKKEHFDYIKEKDVFYRNDVNDDFAKGGALKMNNGGNVYANKGEVVVQETIKRSGSDLKPTTTLYSFSSAQDLIEIYKNNSKFKVIGDLNKTPMVLVEHKNGHKIVFRKRELFENGGKMDDGGMTQGYNDRMDESLGMRHSGKHSQNYKDRRDEAKGMNKGMGHRAYQSVGTMDKMNYGGNVPESPDCPSYYLIITEGFEKAFELLEKGEWFEQTFTKEFRFEAPDYDSVVRGFVFTDPEIADRSKFLLKQTAGVETKGIFRVKEFFYYVLDTYNYGGESVFNEMYYAIADYFDPEYGNGDEFKGREYIIEGSKKAKNYLRYTLEYLSDVQFFKHISEKALYGYDIFYDRKVEPIFLEDISYYCYSQYDLDGASDRLLDEFANKGAVKMDKKFNKVIKDYIEDIAGNTFDFPNVEIKWLMVV